MQYNRLARSDRHRTGMAGCARCSGMGMARRQCKTSGNECDCNGALIDQGRSQCEAECVDREIAAVLGSPIPYLGKWASRYFDEPVGPCETMAQ